MKKKLLQIHVIVLLNSCIIIIIATEYYNVLFTKDKGIRCTKLIHPIYYNLLHVVPHITFLHNMHMNIRNELYQAVRCS